MKWEPKNRYPAESKSTVIVGSGHGQVKDGQGRSRTVASAIQGGLQAIHDLLLDLQIAPMLFAQ